MATRKTRAQQRSMTAAEAAVAIERLFTTQIDVRTDYHAAARAQLAALGWSLDRFREVLLHILADGDDELYAFKKDEFVAAVGVPDAYLICPETQHVVVVEIDVTHPTSVEKWAPFAFLLDCEGWSMDVVTVERAGVAVERWSDGELCAAAVTMAVAS